MSSIFQCQGAISFTMMRLTHERRNAIQLRVMNQVREPRSLERSETARYPPNAQKATEPLSSAGCEYSVRDGTNTEG